MVGGILGAGLMPGIISNKTMSFATAGVYQLRVAPADANNCTPNWSNGTPDDHHTFAIVCVH